MRVKDRILVFQRDELSHCNISLKNYKFLMSWYLAAVTVRMVVGKLKMRIE